MADRDPSELHQLDHAEEAPAGVAPAIANSKKKLRMKVLAALVAGKLLIGAGAYAFMGGDTVSTDNAYVAADSAQVTPLVSAAVVDVRSWNSNTPW